MLYLADLVESASNINLRGIMALPDINANASDRETEMREIIDLSKKLQKKYPHASEISMGTTNDGTGKLTIFDSEGRETLNLVRSLTTFNQDGKITGKYGTNNSGNGSVFLYDRFGNRGWYKTGKNS